MPSLTSVLTARIEANYTNALDLTTGTTPLDRAARLSWASGTAINTADMIFTDTRTIAASSNEDLDLAGSLTGAYGNTLTFARLKALLIVAATGNTNNVRVTRPASNGVPLFLAASDGIDVRPGGFFFVAAPDATAYAVTAGTGDLINVANSSSGTSVTYDVVLIGASA